jgi:flagellar motor switch/type III secretory pathway protein FliN
LLDVVCGGDGSRPFDPTALGEVDRAVIDWIVNRTAQTTSQSLFGADGALCPSPNGAAEPEWWFAAAVRVGGYHGVWWLGATSRFVEAAARLMRPRRERGTKTEAALGRVAIVLVARARLGRVSVDALATLGPGDVFVSRGGLALADGRAVGACTLEVVGADGPAVPATLVARADGLAARVHALRIGEEDGIMSENDRADGAGDAPFDAVLEGIGVAVSVEIARRRMALGELLALSSGDVVELDGPPRNSVTLLIDGSPFARGELVDVDGALGVRVLAVGGRTT